MQTLLISSQFSTAGPNTPLAAGSGHQRAAGPRPAGAPRAASAPAGGAPRGTRGPGSPAALRPAPCTLLVWCSGLPGCHGHGPTRRRCRKARPRGGPLLPVPSGGCSVWSQGRGSRGRAPHTNQPCLEGTLGHGRMLTCGRGMCWLRATAWSPNRGNCTADHSTAAGMALAWGKYGHCWCRPLSRTKQHAQAAHLMGCGWSADWHAHARLAGLHALTAPLVERWVLTLLRGRSCFSGPRPAQPGSILPLSKWVEHAVQALGMLLARAVYSLQLHKAAHVSCRTPCQPRLRWFVVLASTGCVGHH